jgi:hypothetical protein
MAKKKCCFASDDDDDDDGMPFFPHPDYFQLICLIVARTPYNTQSNNA